MAGRFEPFLINPPRRVLRRPRRYRLNDYDPGMEAADIGEMGIGVRPGRKSMGHRGKRKAKAKRRLKKKLRIKVAKRRVAKKTRARKSGISHVAAVKRAKKAARTRKLKARMKVMAKRGRKRGRKRSVRVRGRFARTRHAAMRSQWFKPRRRVKRKGYAKKHKRHVIVAYKHRGHLYTSPFAKKVWANHRLNPFGAEMMTMGANPRRRRRRRAKYSLNPRRRRRYMARGRRRFSRNPMGSIQHLLPMIAAGTAGALVTKMTPRLIGVTNTMAVFGTQAAVVFGGGWLVDKWMGKSASDGWIVGSASALLSNLLGGVLGGVFAGLGLEYEAFPGEVGAFPGNQMGMLADMGNAYGAMDEEFEPTVVY